MLIGKHGNYLLPRNGHALVPKREHVFACATSQAVECALVLGAKDVVQSSNPDVRDAREFALTVRLKKIARQKLVTRNAEAQLGT